MLFGLKISIVIALLGMGVLLYILSMLGRASGIDRVNMPTHKIFANWLISATLLLVVLVVLMKLYVSKTQHVSAVSTPTLLLFVHLACSFTFLTLMLRMRYWERGDVHPRFHRKAGRFISVPYVLMAITGISMLARV